ncbi:hypothetical protein P4V06_27060, partial [Brevibacillus parabrevis]|nr:hypothetical protein [Brevibacillus parabrevis]
KKDMVVAEAVLTVYSGGMGTAALKGGKSVAKLDVDAPHGSKKPHANGDSDGGKGRGGPLHGSGKNDMLEGVPLKDGKLKTKAKLLDDVLKELSETIAKFLEKMSEQLNGRLVVIEDATTGQRFFSWEKGEGYSFSKDRTGQGGSHSSGTSKGHDGKATDTDVPSKDMLPKGGKASGNLGHSHHDEPVTGKKGNDANKNQSHEKEKEKAGAEGTGDFKPIKEVEIVDKNGRPIGEFDEIDMKNGIFYEDKTAKGLDILNPKTGLPAQTPQQFADKQILTKTRNRINNLQNSAVSSRPTANGSPEVPSLEEIKGIRQFVFRLDGDTPELREAVERSLEQLRKEFPEYTFDVQFGGKK